MAFDDLNPLMLFYDGLSGGSGITNVDVDRVTPAEEVVYTPIPLDPPILVEPTPPPVTAPSDPLPPETPVLKLDETAVFVPLNPPVLLPAPEVLPPPPPRTTTIDSRDRFPRVPTTEVLYVDIGAQDTEPQIAPPTPVWVFGPTQEARFGFPPPDYVQRNDGYWWPPATIPPEQEIDNTPITIVQPNPNPALPPTTIVQTPVYTNPPSKIPFTQSPVTITVRIQVQAMPVPKSLPLVVNVKVYPAIPVFGIDTINIPTTLNCIPIPVRARDSIYAILREKLAGKVESFFDVDRAGKTLLNFGNDYQTVITNWQYDPRDPNRTTLLVKLYRPLPEEVPLRTKLWITREISPPVVDRLFTVFIPDAPTLLYLRPPNKNVDITGQSGYGVDNVTLETLFTSSSLDLIKPTDPVLEEWFTFDVNNSELNVDYSDYRNFIFYSSAEQRLNAFTEKMRILENLTDILALHSASLAGTGSAVITGSSAYTAIQSLADQRLDTLRSFDGYERFLYYQSGVPYSSSLVTDDYQDEIFYNVDSTWPKISGSNVTVAQAESWLGDQIAIAREYDRFNQDRLANNLPGYLRDDADSAEFLKFMDMVGHQMDMVKLYIDQMSLIYDRGNDPTVGLSQDVAWNIADSFGVQLPNQYAIKQLVDYTVGESAIATPKIYREAAAETWRRFLHNQIYLMKAKGTRNSLRGLSNAYGVLPTTLQIRESATPGFSYPTGTFEVYEEQTNVLSFTDGAYVTLPWQTGSLTPQTLEFRFSTTQATSSVMVNAANNQWAVVLESGNNTLGQIQLRNATNVTVASSSFFNVRSGDFYSVMLRNDTTGVSLQVKRAEGEDLVDESVSTATSGAINWASPTQIFLGGSGSFFGLNDWTGLVDEIRVWGERITNDVFDLHVRYPGLYNGNDTNSAKDSLYTRLSFNTPRNLGITGSLPNESPFIRVNGSPLVNTIPATGFLNIPTFPNNMTIINREVLRYAPSAGGSQYTTNKVVIADPPVLQYMTFASESAQIPVLSRNKSIVTLRDKEEQTKSTNVVGFFFSLTDAINDSIIRSIGNIDLQNLIGDPADQFKQTYPDLKVINDLYWESYAYSYNPNSFVDFVKNLLEPLFKQAKQFIPVRAKLLSGIVHEPHILERAKAPLRPVLKDELDWESNALTSEPEQSAGITDNDAVIPTPEIFVTEAFQDNQDTLLVMDDLFTLAGEDTNNETTIDTEQVFSLISDVSDSEGTIDASTAVFTIDSGINFFDEYTNLISVKQNFLQEFGVTSEVQLSPQQLADFNRMVATYRSANVISIQDNVLDPAKNTANNFFPTGTFLSETVLPYTNFDTLDSYTYFTQPEGIIGTIGYTQIRRRNNSLVDRGTWTLGATYARDDYVLAENEQGVVKEWVCITTDLSFESQLEPYLDYRNWRQMQYISQETVIFKKAVLMNGMVSLVDTGSLYTPVVGYLPTHYRFTRDYRLGIIRHQWLGCVQTDDTTTDGRPVVETLFSAGDTLTVNNSGEPVQPTDNQAGPILDVQ